MIWLRLVVVCAAFASSAAVAANDKVLNVFTWPDYIAPNTIADFEAEYGIEVNYDTYDSTEMAEARLLAGRTGYDVVVHAEPCRPGCPQGEGCAVRTGRRDLLAHE